MRREPATRRTGWAGSCTPAAAAKTDVSSDSEEGEVKVKEETGQIKRSLGK